MTQAVAYMRCSGLGQVSGDTWDRQHDSITRACGDAYSLVREFREEGVSGKNDEDNRPAFQDMVTWMLEQRISTVFVESLDRLAREYRVQEQLITYLAAKGMTLIAANTGENITEAMMGDPMRRAMVQMQGVFAELDKNLTVAKLRKARDRKRLSHGKCEGRKAYGEKEGENDCLSTIRTLKANGYMPNQIAATLNREGMRTRYGKLWNRGSIARILARHQKAA